MQVKPTPPWVILLRPQYLEISIFPLHSQVCAALILPSCSFYLTQASLSCFVFVIFQSRVVSDVVYLYCKHVCSGFTVLSFRVGTVSLASFTMYERPQLNHCSYFNDDTYYLKVMNPLLLVRVFYHLGIPFALIKCKLQAFTNLHCSH